MENNKRQSNIELLRILAICGVIVLHYNNGAIGGGFNNAKGVNLYILYYLESMFICAVNLFILISGYFMCEKEKRSLHKPLELLIQVIVLNIIGYLFTAIIYQQKIVPKQILEQLIPANWFVILYIVLYFISPFLNMVINETERRGVFRSFCIIIVVLFMGYPTFVDMLGELMHQEYRGLSSVSMYGSQWGYSIINFSAMYILGAYLKRKHITNDSVKHSVLFFLSALILTIWAIINDKIGFGTERSAWEYCNPINAFMAIEIFKWFQKIQVGYKMYINRLAEASFTVYLIHGRLLRYFDIPKYVKGNPLIMLGHIAVTVICIYLGGVVVYYIYNKLFSPIYVKIYKMCPGLTRNILN